jgi:hypothetical protein
MHKLKTTIENDIFAVLIRGDQEFFSVTRAENGKFLSLSKNDTEMSKFRTYLSGGFAFSACERLGLSFYLDMALIFTPVWLVVQFLIQPCHSRDRVQLFDFI